MKLKVSILIIIIIAVVGIGAYLLIKSNSKSDEPIEKDIVSQITLNSEQYVSSLEKIKIGNTNDYFVITENVKWEVSDHESGLTVSFSIAIPYTITVDGVDYNGVYELNDASWSTDDGNPKYDFKITNLTKDGEIEVLVTRKK